MNKRMRLGVSALVALVLLQIPHTAIAQSEGVKVHGRWTIDIREPNGTLVTHREFDNALMDNSRYILASILRGDYTHGEWQIVLEGAGSIPGELSPATSACSIDGVPYFCLLVEPTHAEQYSEQPSWISRNLSTLPPTQAGLILKGSITAARDGLIGKVRTVQTLCNGDMRATECKGNNPNAWIVGADTFTSVVLAQPQSVVAGQIIQVTVVLSFQ